MKKIILKLTFMAILAPLLSCTQSTKSNQETETPVGKEKQSLPKPYNESQDGDAKITELIQQAQKEGKNIMIQAGGNWCIWCLRFDNFVKTDSKLKQIVDDNYIYYHLNFSPKNKNEKAFAKYGTTEKIGYPHFIILDQNGKKLHLQESGIFEDGKGYSKEKVKEFFEKWTPKK